MKPDRETRLLAANFELRNEEGKDPVVRGYAAVFEKESENLGSDQYQFREVIQRGAFDEVLADDVRALLNHDPNFILARSVNGEGTLKIGTDERGLWYEFEAPDTQAGRDLVTSMRRGDITQSSFSFRVGKEGQKWEERQEGDGPTFIRRTITKVARLFDVSPVTYPAYPDASVAVRSLESFRAENPAKQEKAPPAPPDQTISIRHWQRRAGSISKPAV